MGTMIQRYQLTEADYRGERFKDWKSDLKGNNDLLILTQPKIIRDIHSAYFDAVGALWRRVIDQKRHALVVLHITPFLRVSEVDAADVD